jgi:DNA-binding SARP family transcriptional activator
MDFLILGPLEVRDGDRPVGVAVSRLRKVLEPGLLVTRSPGYELSVDPERLDSQRFERLAAEGRAAVEGGDTSAGSKLLAEALDLWRGAPFADLSYAEVRS